MGYIDLFEITGSVQYQAYIRVIEEHNNGCDQDLDYKS